MFASPISSDELQSGNLFVSASFALVNDIATEPVSVPTESQIVRSSFALNSVRSIVPARAGDNTSEPFASPIESDALQSGNQFVSASSPLRRAFFVPSVHAVNDTATEMFASPIASDEIQCGNLIVPASFDLVSDGALVSVPMKSRIIPASALDPVEAIVPFESAGGDIASELSVTSIERDVLQSSNHTDSAYFPLHREYAPSVRGGRDVATRSYNRIILATESDIHQALHSIQEDQFFAAIISSRSGCRSDSPPVPAPDDDVKKSSLRSNYRLISVCISFLVC